jgi:5-methylcytosine-specific restriction endonuclease McrA
VSTEAKVRERRGVAKLGRGEIVARRLTLAAADKTAKRAMNRASAYGYKGPHFTGAEWLAVLLEAGGRCLACGEQEDPTVDHVIPLALGGPNTIENVQPLCSACNNLKGCEVADYRTR